MRKEGLRLGGILPAQSFPLTRRSGCPFFEIYKFDLRAENGRKFVDGVNRFCRGKNMSLRRFFFTLETHRLDSYHIAQQRQSVQDVLNFCLEKHKAEATRAKKVLGSLANVRALPE